MFVPNFDYGEVVNNDEIVKEFGCSPQGGMRLSTRTNSLILICKHISNPYEDEWFGDVLLYTGMGRVGNQTLEGNQNKTLYNTYARPSSNDPAVHLFEVYREGEYTYHGIVEVADKPYKGRQLDDNGNMRDVWIFPLKLLGTNPILPDYGSIKQGSGRSKPREDLRPLVKVEVKKTVEKCCYANTLEGFMKESKENWLSTMKSALANVQEGDASKINSEMWEQTFDILQSDLAQIVKERPGFNIIFEYRLPYGFGRRPDVMLISNEQEIIIEFPRNLCITKRTVDQVLDYFNDLKEYHPLSKGKKMNALVYSSEKNVSTKSGISYCKPGQGYEAIKSILKENTTRNNLEKWIRSK